MKIVISFIVACFFVSGCDNRETAGPVRDSKSAVPHKPNQSVDLSDTQTSGSGFEIEKPVASKSNSAVPVKSDANNMISQALKLAMAKQENGEISDESLQQLIRMAPLLKIDSEFWEVIRYIPKIQIGPFREQILSSLRALTDEVNQPHYRALRNAHNSLVHLSDPEIAKIAWAQFQLAPEYHFPNDPAPKGWPVMDHQTVEHMEHGVQGVLARATLRNADEQVIRSYRLQLKSANPSSQRVLIWALGQYGKIEDFDLLMSLKDEISEKGTKDTLVRALNRMLDRILSTRGDENQAVSQRYRQLHDQKLVVTPSVYD